MSIKCDKCAGIHIKASFFQSSAEGSTLFKLTCLECEYEWLQVA